MKVYEGARSNSNGAVVIVRFEHNGQKHTRALDPRHDLRNHSPDGFEWGYGGSGPAQLALALCIDHLGGDLERAQRVYHGVKFALIGPIQAPTWTLTTEQIAQAIEKIEGARERVTGE